MFCPECGADHHVADRAAQAEADRAVELARIEANRDITIAKIQASVTRDTADVDQAAELAHAEGVATGMETALSAAVDGQAEEPGEPGAPVVVEAPAEPELEAPAEPELAPPVVDVGPPSSSSRSSGGGWFDGYR